MSPQVGPAAGATSASVLRSPTRQPKWRTTVNGIIYLVGLVVVGLAVLSLLGLR